MATLPTIVPGLSSNLNGVAITGTEPVLEAIASPVDTSYAHSGTNNAGGTFTADFDIGGSIPADFGTMSSLSVRLRYLRAAGTAVNTWNNLLAEIVDADGNPLTGSATVVINITTTTATNSNIVAFPSLNTTAGRAAWAGARLRISWNITRNMGGDTIERRVTAAQLTGTYEFPAGEIREADLNSGGAGVFTTETQRIGSATASAQGAATPSLQSSAIRGATIAPAGVGAFSGQTNRIATSAFSIAGSGAVALADDTFYPEAERTNEVLGAELLFFEIVSEATKTYAETDIGSVGAATVTAAGASFATTTLASAGSATVTQPAAAIGASVLASAGSATVTGAAGARGTSTLAAAGAGAVTATTGAIRAATAASTGSGVLTAQGVGFAAATWASAGSSTVTLAGARVTTSTTTSVGTAVTLPAGAAVSATNLNAQGAAAVAVNAAARVGVNLNATASAVGAFEAAGGVAVDADLNASGTSAATLQSQSTRAGTLASAGTAAVTGNTARVAAGTMQAVGSSAAAFVKEVSFAEADMNAVGAATLSLNTARIATSNTAPAGTGVLTGQTNRTVGVNMVSSGESFMAIATGPDALRILRPDATITTSGFTGGFAEIDEETASDGDFAWGANNTVAVLEVGLQDPVGGAPGPGTTTIRYRVAKTNNGTLDGGGNAVSMTVALYQGTTLIASDTARALTGTWTTYEWTPDLSAVTDWNDVRLRFTTTASAGTVANRRGGAVSWAEVEIPDPVLSSVASTDAYMFGSSAVTFNTSTIRGVVAVANGQATVTLPAVRISGAQAQAQGQGAASLSTATIRGSVSGAAGAAFAQWLSLITRDAELAAAGLSSSALVGEREVEGSSFGMAGASIVILDGSLLQSVALVTGAVATANFQGTAATTFIDVGDNPMARPVEVRGMTRFADGTIMAVAADVGLNRPDEPRSMEVTS